MIYYFPESVFIYQRVAEDSFSLFPEFFMTYNRYFDTLLIISRAIKTIPLFMMADSTVEFKNISKIKFSKEIIINIRISIIGRFFVIV